MKNEKKTKEQLIGELVEMRQRVAELEALEIKFKQAEEAFRDSQTQAAELQHLYQKAPIGLCFIDTDMRYVRINQGLADINGKSISEHVGKTIQQVIPDIAPQVESLHRRVIESGEPALDMEVVGETVAKPGVRRYWLGNHYPVKLSDGTIAGVSVVVQEITEHVALQESEEKFRHMAEHIKDALWLVDAKTYQILYVNPSYKRIWGLTCQSLYDQPLSWLDAVHPEDSERVKSALEKQAFTRKFEEEFRIVRPDGSIRWIWDRGFPILDKSGQVYRIVGIAEDITERAQAEEKTKASLREKEVLLKEVHHRVKNNLQVISSLINLQARYTTDEQILQMFEEIQNRIQSMALIHEKLHQSEDMVRIDFSEYIQSLTAYLYQTYGAQSADITLKSNADDIFLDIDIAVPCGLILNELVSNSLKHAFTEELRGEIRIDFHSDTDNQLTLTVSDNGVGFPQDLDFRNTESLGLRLIVMLTEQLDGTLELDSSDGTKFEITFENGWK